MKDPRLFSDPSAVDLLALLRALEREHPERPRIARSAHRAEDIVTLRQEPWLAFPDANLAAVEEDADGRLVVTARFLGLLGAQGPMPLSLTEEAYRWQVADEPGFARFLDIINNRFIQLFFRAWADARPVAQHDRPHEDRFRDYLGALVGLYWAGEGESAVSPFEKAAFAGLLHARVKSASRLGSFLSGLFEATVEIEEFVPLALPLEPADTTRLGAQNASLGVDAMMGSRVLSFEEKIRVRVIARSLAEYESFLPGGRNAARLADAVTFYLGRELDWDAELVLPVEEAPAAELGRSGALGWTGWVNPRHEGQAKTHLSDARIRLAA